MIISHKNQFIFVHLHKCAGTSITIALLPYLAKSDIVMGCTPKFEILSNESRKKGSIYKHSSAQNIRDYVGESIWNNYFKFSFVRNPWDIAVSRYFWWHKTPADWNDKAKIHKRKIMNMNFTQYIKKRHSPINKTFLPNLVSHYGSREITESPPQIDLDFIGKFETLQEDFNMICKKLGFPAINLSIQNASYELRKGRPYYDYYNNETKNIIQELYADEIRLFNYKFAN